MAWDRLTQRPEGQFLERKSCYERSAGSLQRRALQDIARDVAETLTAMANADGGDAMASKYVEDDHKLVRFYIPPKARWPSIRRQTTGLGGYLTDVVRTVARENPKLHGVIDVAEFNATT